ncbi:MAG: hypothetical protein JOS17DRAFT_748858 [Linnemannia elongata]|nr:MAG: hypothetical protein JOS17DRAFT_748858 [Linnemannia elongata]
MDMIHVYSELFLFCFVFSSFFHFRCQSFSCFFFLSFIVLYCTPLCSTLHLPPLIITFSFATPHLHLSLYK